MDHVDPRTLDLPTLAFLAGHAANHHVLGVLRSSGHPHIRISFGYVFQHLIVRSPTVGELAALLGVSQQAASKSVAELEALGYVQRAADEKDARIRRVGLTPSGWAAITLAREARAELEAHLADRVGPGAVEATRTTLATLLQDTGGTPDVARRQVRPGT